MEIYNKIALYDHTIYRALLGIYAFGMSTLCGSKNYMLFFNIKVCFDNKCQTRKWEKRFPGISKLVTSDKLAAKHHINGIIYYHGTTCGSFYHCDNQGKYHNENGPAVKIVETLK